MSERLTGPYPWKQLSMIRTWDELRRLGDPQVPEGYVLREYRTGDEDGWLELLHLCGFNEWTREAIDMYLRDPERRQGSRVVVRDGRIVAASFASLQDSGARVGVLDYVASHPDHRNRGLARAATTAVLESFRQRGYDSVVLLTDDWRLPAIGLYLSLGFVPEMTREDMPRRWEAVMRNLAEARNQPAPCSKV